MYRINYLQRPTLITPDEVLFHAAMDGSVGEREILQNIIVAEERIIAPALCDDFYEELITLKNKELKTQQDVSNYETLINTSLEADSRQPLPTGYLKIGMWVNAIEFVTDQNYLALWNRFLWKLTAEAVDMMCVVPGWLRHTNQGQQKNNPEVIGGSNQGSASGDRRDVQFKLDILMQDRIDPLVERMHQWICKRKDRFANYCKQCDCGDNNGISVNRKTDWVFNAYDKKDDCGCVFK